MHSTMNTVSSSLAKTSIWRFWRFFVTWTVEIAIKIEFLEAHSTQKRPDVILNCRSIGLSLANEPIFYYFE